MCIESSCLERVGDGRDHEMRRMRMVIELGVEQWVTVGLLVRPRLERSDWVKADLETKPGS